MAELQGVCEEGTVVDSQGIKSDSSCPEKDEPQSEESGDEEGVEESSDEEGVEESSDEEPEEESSDEELVEPVLKYRRFAKEAVIAINQGPEGMNIICCVAVHQRVSRAFAVITSHALPQSRKVGCGLRNTG